MEKKLIYMGIAESDEFLLKKISKKYKIQALGLSKDDYDKKIGTLLGLNDFDNSKESNNCDIEEIQFILFTDFDRNIMKNFLLDLKKEGLIISHKAVQTQTNINWTLSYLLNHLSRERRLLIKFKNLGFYISHLRKIIDESNEDENLKILLNKALTFRNKKIEEKEIDNIIGEIEKYLQKYL